MQNNLGHKAGRRLPGASGAEEHKGTVVGDENVLHLDHGGSHMDTQHLSKLIEAYA